MFVPNTNECIECILYQHIVQSTLIPYTYGKAKLYHRIKNILILYTVIIPSMLQ